MLPRFFLIKWCKLSQFECSKKHYYQPKNQHFKDNKSTLVKIIRHTFYQYQYKADKHANTFRFFKGGLGASSQKPKILISKSNETKAFPLR